MPIMLMGLSEFLRKRKSFSIVRKEYVYSYPLTCFYIYLSQLYFRKRSSSVNKISHQKFTGLSFHLFPSPLELGEQPQHAGGAQDQEPSCHMEDQPWWPSGLPLTSHWALPSCCLRVGAAASLEPWPWPAAGRDLFHATPRSLPISSFVPLHMLP